MTDDADPIRRATLHHIPRDGAHDLPIRWEICPGEESWVTLHAILPDGTVVRVADIIDRKINIRASGVDKLGMEVAAIV